MRLLKLVCTTLAIVSLLTGTRAINLGKTLANAADSAKDIGVGVAKDLGNKLPTPQGLFETGKQVIAGYPFEFAFSAINTICSSALSSQTIMPHITPDIHKMQFQLRTACNRYSFPLLEADKMWKSPEFDPKKKVVILATGWTTTVNETDTVTVLAKAYNCRGDVNFVAVDAAQFVDTLYTWSAFNTEEIGMHIGVGLMQLIEIVPLKNIHLIGHSLGAHIMGAAARHFNYMTGKTVPRITGLDPAKPCFNEGENLSGLLRGDADFIDVIHTNCGVLGKRSPLGDVDFYPNGLDPLMPGCIDIVCAHARSWWYFAETVYPGNEKNFMGKRCSSLTRLRENKCPGEQYPMGFAVPQDLRGNYFLEVNRASPYGKNGDMPRNLINEKCGLCSEKA